MASFNLRDLPPATWAAFEAKAKAEGRPLRPLLFALVEGYLKNGMPPGVTSPVMSRQRTDGKVSFVAPCAMGHLPVVEFDRAELLERLRTGTLAFYCIQCDVTRPATENEYVNIARRLEDGTL